jgi:hypothetical protein
LKTYLPEDLARLANENSRVPGNREWLIILGASLLIMAALFFWAAYIRKSKRKSLGGALYSGPPVKIYRDSRRDRPRKRRRRRKNRNPTLAQTGGLPPARADEISSDISPS